MDRLEKVRQVVDEILRQQSDLEERRCGFVHLYGVAQTCVLLAQKRGFDPQVCAVMGMLHDIATYRSGDPTNHAPRSAVEAAAILNETGGFSQEEIDQICQAISTHSAKDQVDGALAELLKDADVLQHHLYNPALPKLPDSHRRQRYEDIMAELAIGMLNE
jgi:uncharacterized protein